MEETPATAEQLLRVVHGVVLELHPHRADEPAPRLDSRLDEELGFDSLGRVELVARLEREFAVSLPEQVLVEAETPRDLLRATVRASARLPAGGGEAPAEAPELHLEEVEGLPDRATTMLDMLAWHVEAHPDRTHILLYDEHERYEEITYGQLWAEAERVAGGLLARDLEPGQAVAIMLPTGEGYLYSFFGILMAGGVPVPIYPPVRPSQIEDHLRRHAGIVRNARAPVLITLPEARPVARLLRAQAETLHAVVTVEELAAAGRPGSRPAVKPEDTAFVQYTSGSTGQPKGVVLSHANLLANIRAMGRAARVDATEVFVSWLPLYHDMGLIGAWFGSMYYAFPLVLMSPLTFLSRPERWLQAIHRHRGTITASPNFGYELCLRRVEDETLEGLDLGSLRFAANGAEPVSPETVTRFQERFAACGLRPHVVSPVYGLAECAVGVAFSPPGRGMRVDRVRREPLMTAGRAEPAGAEADDALRVVACGRPLPGHEIRVVDEVGQEVEDRRQGHVQFRGPSTTSGYLRNAEATAGLFDDGWLNSGDLGYLAEGDLYLTGRDKDVIIRGGRNIYPYELEQAIGDLEEVRKGCVAIFGSPDPHSGTERVVVVAETREDDPARRTALQQEIERLAVDHLGSAPDVLVLAPPRTVLKTSSGKIRRQATRELFEQRRIGRRERAVWLQVVRLVWAGLVPQVRRYRRMTASYAFAAYWFAMLALVAPFLWTSVVLAPTRGFAWWVTRNAARLFLRLTGAPPRVSGWRPTARGGYLYVSNHASYTDSLVLAASLPGQPAFVAKRELAGNPFSGWFLRRIGTEFVERFDKQRGVEDARRVGRAARAGRPLVYFSEGTFTRVSGLRPFHMGAFVAACDAGVPAVPVALRGTRSILRGDSWFPRRGRVFVHIGEPVPPEGTDWEAAIRLRNRVRDEVLRHCGEPDLATDEQPV